MPGLEDIDKSGINQLAPVAQGQVNATLNTVGLDARVVQAAGVLNVLPALQTPEKAFRFVLQQFGLERVQINRYKPGEELKVKDVETGSGYTYQDKQDTTMHTGAGKPALSILGTPVFCDMILTGPADKLNSSSTSVQLLNVLCDVEQTKNIVKTTVQGADGTVKEYISDGDYMITLRGVLYNTFQKDYPKQGVQQLLKVFKRKQALDVTSEYLSLFGVRSVVVESFHMAQEMGKQNMQKFEAVCSSDLPLLLKKKGR